LGLSLVESFVEMYGGKVALKSAPDVGTSIMYPAIVRRPSAWPNDLAERRQFLANRWMLRDSGSTGTSSHRHG
jgi:hypothetical protein